MHWESFHNSFVIYALWFYDGSFSQKLFEYFFRYSINKTIFEKKTHLKIPVTKLAKKRLFNGLKLLYVKKNIFVKNKPRVQNSYWNCTKLETFQYRYQYRLNVFVSRWVEIYSVYQMDCHLLELFKEYGGSIFVF